MSWYFETFNKYNSNYVSKDYYLELIGNTICVCKKPKWYRKSKCVFHIGMAHPKFSDDVMEFILYYYRFYKVNLEVKKDEKE